MVISKLESLTMNTIIKEDVEELKAIPLI